MGKEILTIWIATIFVVYVVLEVVDYIKKKNGNTTK